jgi:hypothetical protein
MLLQISPGAHSESSILMGRFGEIADRLAARERLV